MVKHIMREEWKYVLMNSGIASVMKDGQTLKQSWYASSLITTQQVSMTDFMFIAC